MRKSRHSEDDLKPLLKDEEAMSKDNTDPFYTVKDNVNSQVEKIKISCRKYVDFVENNDTSSNGQYLTMRKALSTDIRKAKKEIDDLLMEAINMIEKNREKFPHIKDAELAQRRRIVDEMKTIIKDVQASSDSSSVRKKIENDQRKAEGKGISNSSASTMNAIHKEIEEDDNRFIANQGRQQEQKIAAQDGKLLVLGQGVDNLGMHAKVINTELKEQDKILDELGTDMDNAGDKMNVVMASLSKLLKTKDGCQLWTIVILAVVLIILVALIIWV